MMATMRASTRRSNYGMACVQCGDLKDERHVLNLWSCTNCGYQFEHDIVPGDTDLVRNEFAIRAFFPGLLVA